MMATDTSWIDSDSALALAESEGGSDFRNNHTSFKITASLSKPLVPNSTNRWYIYYISLDDPYDELFINLDATDNLTNVAESADIPTDLILYQNYPNPFNPSTTIQFALNSTEKVTLIIYDLLGNEISLIVDTEKLPGKHSVVWDGSVYASGVYLCRLSAGKQVQTKKLVLIK